MPLSLKENPAWVGEILHWPCLTAVALLAADNFWTKSGTERVAQANTFFEHLGPIGGFVLFAIIYAR